MSVQPIDFFERASEAELVQWTAEAARMRENLEAQPATPDTLILLAEVREFEAQCFAARVGKSNMGMGGTSGHD